jgi:hypothetical protein
MALDVSRDDARGMGEGMDAKPDSEEEQTLIDAWRPGFEAPKKTHQARLRKRAAQRETPTFAGFPRKTFDLA